MSGKLFLVAVDDSEHARKAFEMAASLMKPEDRMDIVHVAETHKMTATQNSVNQMEERAQNVRMQFENFAKQRQV
jgi:hypothetical protein